MTTPHRNRIWDDVRSAIGLDEPRPGRVAAKHAPGRPPRIPFALLVVTLVAGGLGLLLLLNTASAANEVRRHDLAAQDASIAAQLQDLENQVAASGAPGNLARAASELGMVPAGNPAFLVVGADGSVKVMGHPKAVTDVAVDHIPAKSSPAKSSPAKSSPAKSSPAKSSPAKSSSAKSSSAKSTSAGRGHRSTAPSSNASPSPTPSSTPTLTVNLPGGTR